MTFQEKYAKKYEEAQKVLQEAMEQIDCVDTIFKSICEKFDEEINYEYNAERIKKLRRVYLHHEFFVKVNFCKSYIEVEEERLCHGASFRELEIIDELTKKLREVGISFKQDKSLPAHFIAKLVFKPHNDNTSDS